jgi:hypothetical protein
MGGYYLHTSDVLDLGKNLAFGADVAYPNDPWTASVKYVEVQRNYDAAVGFVRRTNFRNINPIVTFAPRPRQHDWIRRFNFGAAANWFLDPVTNQTLTREIDITAFEVDTHKQDSVAFHVVPTYELLEEDFRIAPGVTLPVGQEYSFTRYRAIGSTTARRPLAVSSTLEWGNFFSGDRLGLDVAVNLRAAPGQMFTFETEWNRVSLAEGRFYTRLYRVLAETQLNPFLSLSNNIQYDTQSAVVGWQSRFRWIVTPGSDFYIVYIHNWLDDPLVNRTYTLDRRLASKVIYTHRF